MKSTSIKDIKDTKAHNTENELKIVDEISDSSDTNSTTEEREDIVDFNNMGANVSRQNGKGLSGRRTQSSGMYISLHTRKCMYLISFI